MTPGYVLSVIAGYFGLLFIISWLSARKADASTFFIANRQAPWPLVAYGMIGVAISGITFISVPGQVAETHFSYFQMVIGYSLGLFIVAFVLLPLFYKSRAVSIYSFLKNRFGRRTHKTGAILFLLAQVATASFKLFLMASVLQLMLFDPLGFPFGLTVLITLLLIWLYTYRGGIQTVILTDTLQTTFLLLAVLLSIWSVSRELDLSVSVMWDQMQQSGVSKIFYWDWDSPHNFFKLLLTGFFLTVMTNGLDQSVMQKHLTIKDLSSSQKNLVTLGIILLVVNAMFLFLGGSLNLFVQEVDVSMPEQTDDLYPLLAFRYLGTVAGTFFLIGIAAAAYSSADSSLTGLTTSFCVDILNFDLEGKDRPRLRQGVHFGFTVLIFILIMIFEQINDSSVLSAFIRTSGFVYGPLLGLFAFGMINQKEVPDKYIPLLCIVTPLISWVLDSYAPVWFDGFHFGYGILVVNSLIAFIGLYLLSLVSIKGT